jgi:TPR repeat protein
MKQLTHALILFLAILAAANSYTDELSNAEDDYLNGLYDRARTVFLSYGTPGLRSSTGDAIAQYYLGEMFYYGEGVTQNYAEAMWWYSLSAEQGDPDAMYSIGHLYENGMGVDVSIDRAIEWYTKGIEAGSEQAEVAFAAIYLDEESGYFNPEAGLATLSELAVLGNSGAQFILGGVFEDGKLVTQNIATALRWYRLAAEQGDLDARDAYSRIFNVRQYAEDYPALLRYLGFTQDNAEALYCENLVFYTGYGTMMMGSEEGNRRLERFGNRALDRVRGFRSSLNSKLWNEGYYRHPSYSAISELMNVHDEFKEAMGYYGIYDRTEGLHFNLIYENVFTDFVDMMTEDEQFSLYDYCVQKYLPKGIFRADIGFEALESAYENRKTLHRIRYAGVRYGQGIVDLGRNSFQEIRELDICESGVPLPGRALVGTGTRVLAVAAAGTATALSTIAAEPALMIVSQAGPLIAFTHAIAPAVSIAALAGTAIYATTRGYCYLIEAN